MGSNEKGGRPQALVVDDDQVMRLLESETLSQFGFDVTEAADGEAALELLAGPAPDLVLLDVEMPGIDGFEVCRRIRKRRDMSEVPIIMVTGLDDLDSINLAYESGANDFISKPINWPVLGHRARYVLRSARESSQLRELEEKQAAIVSAIPDMILLTNRDALILDCKEAYRAASVVSPIAWLGRKLQEVLPADAGDELLRAIERCLKGNELQSVIYKVPMAAGITHYEARLAPSGAGKVVIVVRDITLQDRDQEKIRRLAYVDGLTGMPNRQSFLERLDRELLRARRDGRLVALMFLDLDGFKRVNDTLGHSAGDFLLQAVARRLKEKLREGDFVSSPALDESGLHFARLGGDEFTVVLPDLEDKQPIETVAQRLLIMLSRPFQIRDQEVTITGSIGIAIFPDDGDDAATLLKHADTAMYHAKDQGRNNWQPYQRALTNQAVKSLALETDMRKGLERAEFLLFYQPQVLEDGTIVGLEALIRWQHPEHGLVSPAEFIPVAEESGLIIPLGEWVIRTSCLQLRVWQQRGVRVPRIAVNVSARQARGVDFISGVEKIIDETGIRADQLELELTESILLDREAHRIEGLVRLRRLGVHFSIDDFGTGYSSLSYIKRFPISQLKIDQSFVRGLPHDPNDAGITIAIIAMARSLDLEVIAEGVETRAQLEFLQQAGCHNLQGYLFSRPLPADEAERLLRRGRIILPDVQ